MFRFLNRKPPLTCDEKAKAKLIEAARLIVAVKHFMMLGRIHDEHHAQEILRKHGAPSVQLLAKKAQDAAEEGLALVDGKGGASA